MYAKWYKIKHSLLYSKFYQRNTLLKYSMLTKVTTRVAVANGQQSEVSPAEGGWSEVSPAERERSEDSSAEGERSEDSSAEGEWSEDSSAEGGSSFIMSPSWLDKFFMFRSWRLPNYDQRGTISFTSSIHLCADRSCAWHHYRPPFWLGIMFLPLSVKSVCPDSQRHVMVCFV